MDTPPPKSQLRDRTFAVTLIERKAVELLSLLLADVTTDVEVAARDLGISDTSFSRCRRAMDRLSCAQSVLETMRVGSEEASGSPAAMRLRMREAVELLARGGQMIIRPGRLSGFFYSLGELEERLGATATATDH